MSCPCNSISIRDCPPYANKDDIIEVLENAACKDCYASVPQGTATGDFVSVGFGGTVNDCCEILYVFVETDEYIYASHDGGTTWLWLNEPQTVVPQPQIEVIVLEQRQTFGTTFASVAGSWVKRPLSNEVVDTGGLCILSSGSFVLEPGKYYFETEDITYRVNTAVSRLITNGGTVLARSIAGYSNSGADYATSNTNMSGYFELGVVTTIEWQVFTEATRANGLGYPLNFAPFNTDSTFTSHDLYGRITLRWLGEP